MEHVRCPHVSPIPRLLGTPFVRVKCGRPVFPVRRVVSSNSETTRDMNFDTPRSGRTSTEPQAYEVLCPGPVVLQPEKELPLTDKRFLGDR